MPRGVNVGTTSSIGLQSRPRWGLILALAAPAVYGDYFWPRRVGLIPHVAGGLVALPAGLFLLCMAWACWVMPLLQQRRLRRR